jgi:hypothetical protein
VHLIKSKREEFKEKWRNHYEAHFVSNENNYPKVMSSWYKSPGPKREYNILQNYKVATPAGANPKTTGTPVADR